MIETLFQIFIYPGFLFCLVLGLLYLGIDRKIVARLQNRIGPPIWQNFLDFFKLMSKETTKPSIASFFFILAPAISFASLLAATITLPFLGSVLFELDNIILIIYLLLLSSVFIALAGFSSGNPFAIVGSVRKITQILAIEFPLLIALFTAVYFVGSLNLTSIITYQATHGYLAFTLPFATIAFLVAVQGELHRIPFDTPEAEQEIVAGPYTEFSGATLAIFELIHALKFVVIISLAVIFFFGGATSICYFLIKFFLLGLLISLLRVLFSRLRIEQTLKFYWLIIAPIALIDLVRVVLW